MEAGEEKNKVNEEIAACGWAGALMTDQPTYRRTDMTSYRSARRHLKARQANGK